MNGKNIEPFVKLLDDISYPEWLKLRLTIDRFFDIKKGESDGKIKLSLSEKENAELIRRLLV